MICRKAAAKKTIDIQIDEEKVEIRFASPTSSTKRIPLYSLCVIYLTQL